VCQYPLSAFIAVHTQMYTRYTCTAIYTEHTSKHSIYTPYALHTYTPLHDRYCSQMFGQYALPHGAGRGYLEEGRRCYTDLYNALIGTSNRMETLLSEGTRTREGREKRVCGTAVCVLVCIVWCCVCTCV
jgi:hypothetical protein